MRKTLVLVTSTAGALVTAGVGVLVTGAGIVFQDQVGPLFLYGGAAVILLGVVLGVLGRFLRIDEPAPTRPEVKADDQTGGTAQAASQHGGQSNRIIQAQHYHEYGTGTAPPAEPSERRKIIRRQADRSVPIPSFQRLTMIDVKEEVVTFGKGSKATKAELVQVWFQNVDPDHTVVQVSAEVTVEYPHQDLIAAEGQAKWAIGTESANIAGWTSLANKVTLAPKEVGKLNVFLHAVDANACFIFNDDARPDSIYRDSDRGDYDVAVQLNGIDYKRTFRFKLVFRGSTLSLNPQGK